MGLGDVSGFEEWQANQGAVMQRSDARKRLEGVLTNLSNLPDDYLQAKSSANLSMDYIDGMLGMHRLYCSIRDCEDMKGAVAVWMGFSVCKGHLERAQGLGPYPQAMAYEKLCEVE